MKQLLQIFDKAGYSIDLEQNSANKQNFTLSYLNNPDGSIRWIWPSNLKQPLFLKFYNILGLKSRVFSSVIKLIFKLGLQKYAFKKLTIYFYENTETLFSKDSKWSIFTGTVGPNRKAVLFLKCNSNSSFVKIPIGENASSLIQNEAQTLEWLDNKEIQSFNYPKKQKTALPVLQISDISENGIRQGDFTLFHVNALKEIAEKSTNVSSISSLPCWNETIRDFNIIKSVNDKRIPNGIIRKLEMLINEIDTNKNIITTFSHGDFTSWNMYQNTDKISIYDWELAKDNIPKGFDAFHFIIQQGILITRKHWKQIESEIYNNLENSIFNNTDNKDELNDYLKLYLIINCVYYLKVYHFQEEWHMQIAWLLNTWNEGLSSLLSIKKAQRELVLIDLFDYIHNETYATLKFGNKNPDELSIYSDVDMCIPKYLAQNVISYLSNHNVVKFSKISVKSFMASIGLVCNDGTILSIDLIWELKRKDIVMMDIDSVLKDTTFNEFGIKEPKLQDTARYVGLFHGLNNAAIPEKYLELGSALKNEENELDKAIFNHFQNQSGAKNTMQYIVKSNNFNKGLNVLKNKLEYLTDLVKRSFTSKGIIITFSGVDGAGKSTIIENIKYRIEKQLRRKVVVIRHRPSILPILSAWTKGKEEAEKQAAATLPRQGKNKSTISSAIRFAYYYCDYLFGQFIVYFKYTLRGYVILYDRYYFDYINDSRRSNIDLPYSITRFGYRFVFKPEFNFFLYADVALILSRKQELDAASIEELTSKYLYLFNDLNKSNPKSKYIPIENIDLETTLKTIIDTIAIKTI